MERAMRKILSWYSRSTGSNSAIALFRPQMQQAKFRNIGVNPRVSMSRRKREMHDGGIVLSSLLLVASVVVILVVLYLRHRNLQMLHQERMAALDKGAAVPLGHTPAPWSPRLYLLRGLLWSFSGVALTVCLFGIAVATQRPEGAETLLWRAKGISRSLEVPLE